MPPVRKRALKHSKRSRKRSRRNSRNLKHSPKKYRSLPREPDTHKIPTKAPVKSGFVQGLIQKTADRRAHNARKRWQDTTDKLTKLQIFEAIRQEITIRNIDQWKQLLVDDMKTDIIDDLERTFYLELITQYYEQNKDEIRAMYDRNEDPLWDHIWEWYDRLEDGSKLQLREMERRIERSISRAKMKENMKQVGLATARGIGKTAAVAAAIPVGAAGVLTAGALAVTFAAADAILSPFLRPFIKRRE